MNEEVDMKKQREWNNKTSFNNIIILIFIFIGVTCMNACGFLFGGSTSWKEEVLLHDGSKIVIKRFYHLGRKPTLDSHERQNLDETITFTLPGSNKKITWKTNFKDSKPEPNSLDLLVLDVVNGIPYIATYPAGCISYNKWKRPNPPYIFFKYDGKEWKQIPLEEFPVEISKVNVIVGRPPAKLQKSFYTIEQVNEENSDIHEEKYKIIVRTPIKTIGREGCPEDVTNGKGKWIGIGRFKNQPSYEACLNVCNREGFSNEYCPCSRLFKTNTKEK
jgi:hypothetical protein